jgi:ADP-heptose:LPS heptosyltransferase
MEGMHSEEGVRARPWRSTEPPRSVLAIRLQAMGDVVITLPYLQRLKNLYPSTRLDFLTRERVGHIPQGLTLFRRIYLLGGGDGTGLQLVHALLMLPRLLRQQYEVVIDLQRNLVSRFMRRMLRPRAWSEFDRFASIPAGTRFCRAIEATGLGPLGRMSPPVLMNPRAGLYLLEEGGWKEGAVLVVLNPAGYYPSRNWLLENYVSFANLWSEHFPGDTKFLVLGLETMDRKASALQIALGERLINLVGRTTPVEALSILQKADLVLSEDSGLMHMAWVSGIPTVALIGSTRGDWCCPPPDSRSVCLHSGDLDCGFCMEAECRYHDTRCLNRYKPEQVFEVARKLLDANQPPAGTGRDRSP